jgi:uncharacterized protein YprB with RNaseH-like and TPR domain
MDSAKLTERLRAIIRPSGASALPGPPPAPPPAVDGGAPHSLERALGGEWRADGASRSLVVERRVDPWTAWGPASVGQLALQIADAADAAPLVANGAAARLPLVFFDLETTGLSGGAGTVAFLIGCGWFEADGRFVTRQHVMARHADEPSLLRAVGEEFGRAGALVSFNGRSFDAPMLETRCSYHRLPWHGGSRPHIDVLHPARRLWGGASECSLVSLERRLFGLFRADDVPGFEVPERYFRFIRTGDARPLEGVLEHNRQDLLSLAALTARLLRLLQAGPGAARDAQEALGISRVYARAGRHAAAREALERALALSESAPCSASVKIDVLRALALAYRRARRFDDSAACWRKLVDVRGCPARLVREANEALAIHHEHRARDLAAAKAFALRTLETGEVREVWAEAARHRLARIERKLGMLDL